MEYALSCLKQLPLNSILILELFIYASFGESLSFSAKRGLFFSFDNPLDSQSAILFGRPENVVIVLFIGWNTKKFCDPSLPK